MSEKIIKLPMYTLSGTPEEIGKQHGLFLKERIYKTIDFYKSAFKSSYKFDDYEEAVLKLAGYFKSAIGDFQNDYCLEIEAIADEISVDPLWIYALNSRSEIMNKFHFDDVIDPNECTALYFKKAKLIGQNWDWADDLENLAVITKINQEAQNKPNILMMTEPGIIGKIGFNSHGIGVVINFLHIDGYDPSSVPSHILLRAIMDSKNISEAKTLLTKYGIGRTSNFIVGDKFGSHFDIEYAGDEYFIFDEGEDIYLHTNHYLGKLINTDPIEYASSFARYERGLELISQVKDQSLDTFKRILLDKENTELPICRKFAPSVTKFLENTGTVCSIIMDLVHLKMHITRGNPIENDFEEIDLDA